MRFIGEMQEGDRIHSIYLCKQRTSAVTRNGKPYENLVIQDRTGTMDAKIWDPNSQGIGEFSAMDFIEVTGEVTAFSGYEDLMLMIRNERARELAGEGHRKWDLVRWGIWYDQTYNNTSNAQLKENMRPYHEYYPIPDTQVALSGGALDNKAYEEGL